MSRQRALDAINLQPVDRIPHWESLSCPAFEQLLTGIDPYQHPRLARLRLYETLPIDVGAVPASDDPIPRLPDVEPDTAWDQDVLRGRREALPPLAPL